MQSLNWNTTRRGCLTAGALGAAGLTLPRWLAAREAAPGGLTPQADACILLFLDGGPSHLDMWDMKPDAPVEVRGEFKSIETSLPGYRMCELLPGLAKHAHRSTIVRSMHHSVNNAHAAAVYCALTGHDRGENGGGTRPTDNPSPGSVLGKLRPPTKPVVPFVHLPYITKEGAGGPPQPGIFGGYLGRATDPLFITRDPNAPDFTIPEQSLTGDITAARLAGREHLFSSLERRPTTDASPASSLQMSRFQERAFDLLNSNQTQQAFRLQDESDAVRDRYGRNIYGQSTLLARRLIEAGTRLVTVSWAPDANATWDTHGGNFTKLRGELLPQLDLAASSLIQDMADRGMLERTVVAILGDFGRSPKVNPAAGRDHWNWCYSLQLIGGGFKPGLIHGASDNIGAYPADNPLIPGDIIATLYTALGISTETLLYDNLNRPHPLVPIGEVVQELLV